MAAMAASAGTAYTLAMAYLDSKQQRAALVIAALGLFLLVALWPFSTGLIGALVLYVVFAPVHRWLSERMPRGIAAIIVILLALVVVVAPAVSIITLIASEAPEMAASVVQSPLVDQLRALRIGPYNVGQQLERVGSNVVTWMGSSALGLLGTATRLGIQITIALFGLYYILMAPGSTWRGVRPFIPFSKENAEALRKRFKDVTISTLIGTFLTAAVQGVLVGVGFAITGLNNPVFWGVVTILFSILPVVGSGLVWGPGVLVLVLEHRYGWAVFLALWGAVLIGNIDNVIRPWVFRRYAQIHPFITVIGAFAGLTYFGLLGLLIGPLAISYFFELIRMYREEYLPTDPAEAEEPIPPPRRPRLSWRGKRVE